MVSSDDISLVLYVTHFLMISIALLLTRPSLHSVFLSAPGYLLLLGLRNGQPLRRKESLIMVIVGSAGAFLPFPRSLSCSAPLCSPFSTSDTVRV